MIRIVDCRAKYSYTTTSMSSQSLALINEIITNPTYHDYLAILKGARNGFVYGVKVRFPHALVMSILFGRGEYVYLLYKSQRKCLP